MGGPVRTDKRVRISVAMCTYNGADHLHEQLQSIAAQTRLPDELVICDDVSSDETVRVVRDVASAAAFPVRLEVNEHNLRSTANFAKAISLCTGEVIALSDQDDVWLPDRLQRTEREFLDHPSAAMVFGDADVTDEQLVPQNLTLFDSVLFTRLQRRAVAAGLALDVLLGHNVVTGATMAFRSRYRDWLLPIPDGWVHDAWIALLLSAVAEVRMIPEPLIRYRRHARQQIGASRLTFRRMLAMARAMDWPAYCRRDIANYTAARQRLRRSAYRLRDADTLTKLDAKIAHTTARLTMHTRLPARWPLALRELLLGRYARYSISGWRTFAVDLLL